MARSVKKLSLQYQYLELELEDMRELMDEYEIKWSTRFGKYFAKEGVELWKNEKTGELRDSLPEDSKKIKSKKDIKLKKLYRKLSNYLHPDKGGSKNSFHNLKKAYEEDNFLGLVNIASNNKVDIEINEEDIALLEKSVESIVKKIKEIKMTMVWQYYTGNSQSKKIVLDQIEMISGKKIDPEDLVD